MMNEPDRSRNHHGRTARSDPFRRLVEQAYRVLERPAPRHVPGCACAFCADSELSVTLAGRPARDWNEADVARWFARATGEGRGREGVEVESKTDRAVFRFLLPRMLDILAAGSTPNGGPYGRTFQQFAPMRQPVAWSSDERSLLDRFAALLLDRSIQDAEWSHDLFETLQLLAFGGWPLRGLLQQALADPDLPAALARCWGRAGRRHTLFPGRWPPGATLALRNAFVSPLMSERLMNYAMADGTTPEEIEAAMRTADLILRSR
jgi:hypothetical protein